MECKTLKLNRCRSIGQHCIQSYLTFIVQYCAMNCCGVLSGNTLNSDELSLSLNINKFSSKIKCFCLMDLGIICRKRNQMNKSQKMPREMM